jgi:hypothetical protein
VQDALGIAADRNVKTLAALEICLLDVIGDLCSPPCRNQGH